MDSTRLTESYDKIAGSSLAVGPFPPVDAGLQAFRGACGMAQIDKNKLADAGDWLQRVQAAWAFLPAWIRGAILTGIASLATWILGAAGSFLRCRRTNRNAPSWQGRSQMTLCTLALHLACGENCID